MTSGSNGGSSNPLIAAAAAIPFPNPRRTFVQARFSQLDTKDVVAAESKIELSDLLQEITTELKAVYRSKFIFGDYLKHVDANYSGDGGAEFNVAAPPPFEPGYLTVKKAGEGDDKLGGLGGSGAVGGPGGGAGGAGGGGGGGGGGDGDPSREKLRTAEELIKKLYKRNSLLEVENKYLKGTGKQQQQQTTTTTTGKGSGGGAGRGRPTNEIGQIPRHPMLTAKYVRRACSAPPTRLLVGRGGGGGGSGASSAKAAAAGGGASAADPKAAAAAEATVDATGAAAAAADSYGTQALKGRVQALTEALVACQHEHHRLLQEKRERVSLRDSVIRRYLVERDTAIGQLHVLLTEVQDKLANPMRLTRVKQPGGGVNPVVAGNNMLKEVGTKLNEQICQVTKALLQAGAGVGAGDAGGTKDSLLQAALGSDAVPPELAGRRRELLRRVRALAESLPVGKKKALLQLVLELKQVNRALVGAKETVLSTYEALKVRLNNELIKEKLEAAYLRDKVRSYGGTIEDELPFTPAYT